MTLDLDELERQLNESEPNHGDNCDYDDGCGDAGFCVQPSIDYETFRELIAAAREHESCEAQRQRLMGLSYHTQWREAIGERDELKLQLELSKPLYSRRKLREERDEAVDLLRQHAEGYSLPISAVEHFLSRITDGDE